MRDPRPSSIPVLTKEAHFSAGAVAVGAGALATGAAVVVGAAAGSGFCSAPKSGSSSGPLVADIPGAGLVVGISGRSAGGAGAAAWAGGAAAWVGFASVAAGAVASAAAGASVAGV